MKTIKATKLKEVLSSKGVHEGFIDRIFKRINMAKTDSQKKKLEKDLENDKAKLKNVQSDLLKMYIKKYGSEDKIPAFRRKFLEL
tara:strand:+ start:52 stop:306 length:255 start_codon:yes stop_codon:yes gene_type:complete